MTKGGPLDSTLSVSYFTFNQFGFGKYGLASAASYVLFVAIALLSLINSEPCDPRTEDELQ